jgi:ABC-type nitrate/sulfonate/bicarbonate transport system ATPase subunit
MAAVSAYLDSPRTVRVEHVNHHYGEGVSRNQVLFDNCLELEAGQLVIMTGPSGSGKTTLISLIGALRSVQEGTIHPRPASHWVGAPRAGGYAPKPRFYFSGTQSV